MLNVKQGMSNVKVFSLLRFNIFCSTFCCSLFCLLFLSCAPPLTAKTTLSVATPAQANGECVILLHGMARTHRAMAEMQENLTEAGYYTVNVGYPSTDLSIEEIAATSFPKAVQSCEAFNPSAIHFVTHSLGGIIVRFALSTMHPQKLGHVVMLSPPNQGSTATDALIGGWFYDWLNGPAGQQLTTGSDSLPNSLGPADFSLGVITGDRHAFFDFWLSDIIPGPDDGKVSVEQAKLAGMADFLVVHESHPFIMDAPEVIAQTRYFLKHGQFDHPSPDSTPVQ